MSARANETGPGKFGRGALVRTSANLDGLLECVECTTAIEGRGDAPITCPHCARVYEICNGALVMMHSGNALFPPQAYAAEEGGRTMQGATGARARIKGLAPSRSVNLVRAENLKKIARERGGPNERILIIGCGHQKQEILDLFEETQAELIFCDVDKASDTDLYCDSHRLPFRDGCLTGVITTAVLEHVLKPWVVAEEIHRVLRADGYVYSEVPFLQAVHEGPYDFTRFTMSGHRLLFEKFDERGSGVVAGPGTSLTWALTEYFRALSGNRKVAAALRLLAQLLFFWVKFTDHFLGQSRRAQEAASCTFFYGTRREDAVDPQDIIARYGKSNFFHT
ncbi:class I SAM-dependent methyltransferase [Pikeienuella piscinae]|uniref:Class I SAM-dependent methyltransferase n=1 Tax=Pikeienuella piscinae TaxID=2748098 RepID=A0A7L5BZI8_9RHOB|nr:methyltransferase domain-containing protein [Pikeienuella piscinae]QIE55019.1 class I SAM-dependent methyltransferase [Pikeienuella piscinae]